MTYPLAMFVLGVAVGQFALLVVGLVFNHARERRAYEARKWQTPVARVWPPRWDDTGRESIQ